MRQFWDLFSLVYDLFENIYNRKVYQGTGREVAAVLSDSDEVLECACGTGAISHSLAPRCRKLTATDFSDGMLRRAIRRLRAYQNVVVEKADIMRLPYEDARFDVVVAGNVIHLLPDPGKAITELVRVVKPSGKLVIPTYIIDTKKRNRFVAKVLSLLGADFQLQFDLESYQAFFEKLGYQNAAYSVVEGRMPCAIAIIRKE